MTKNFNSLRPRKRFGQNFLIDDHVTERIVESLNLQPGDNVVEIGPGRGALTKKLLERDIELDVIEIDRDLARGLREIHADNAHFTLHEGDVLKFDFSKLPQSERGLHVIGNLPYNISSPLLFHLLDYLPLIRDMTFMLQLELVDRLAAAPGNKDYGRLGIMLQYHCRIEKLFRVGPDAFNPPPKVDSAVVRLLPRPRQELPAVDSTILERLVRQAFSQRRKTLRNNLKLFLDSSDFANLEIDDGLRPENLSPADYLRITAYIAARVDG